MPSSDPRLKSGGRKRLRGAVARQGLPCNKCGQPIDYSGPWHLDELLPRVFGGDPLDPGNVAPAHVACNTAAGARLANTLRRARRDRTKTSGVW